MSRGPEAFFNFSVLCLLRHDCNKTEANHRLLQTCTARHVDCTKQTDNPPLLLWYLTWTRTIKKNDAQLNQHLKQYALSSWTKEEDH